jgi:hypothetical protein
MNDEASFLMTANGAGSRQWQDAAEAFAKWSSPIEEGSATRVAGAICAGPGGVKPSFVDGLALGRRAQGLAALSVAALSALTTLVAPDRAGAEGLFEGWSQGAVTIYGWLPGMEGAQEGPSGEPIVSLDSVSVLDLLDFAFMGTAEIRRDRVGLVFDLEYADLGADGTARGALIPGADAASASVDTTLLMATGAAAYRVVEQDRSWVDVYGGLRFTSVDAGFTARVPALDFRFDRSTSADWVDGIVGVRGRMPLGERFGVTGLADVGGFGLGSGSDLTWQVQATLDYSFSERFVGRLGYRYMSIDYDSSDLKLDIDLSGPLVGLTWAF